MGLRVKVASRVAAKESPIGMRNSYRPFRGLLLCRLAPTACAVGYHLPPLRGWLQDYLHMLSGTSGQRYLGRRLGS